MYIQLKQISKTYQEKEQQQPILHELDLTIQQGEFVSLTGPSGSGKSTLLNLISGIDLPDKGEIIIDNDNICALNEQQRTHFRRYHIGFIFQFFNLIPTLTIAENMLFPLALTRQDDKDAEHKIMTLLDNLNLRDKKNRFPEQLSGGEQQRVAIARALIHQPKILLADEPTGNLDGENADNVLSLLQQLQRYYKMTMLVVTHSPAVAQKADRSFAIHAGKVNCNEITI